MDEPEEPTGGYHSSSDACDDFADEEMSRASYSPTSPGGDVQDFAQLVGGDVALSEVVDSDDQYNTSDDELACCTAAGGDDEPADESCAGAASDPAASGGAIIADDGKRGFAGRRAYLLGRGVARQQLAIRSLPSADTAAIVASTQPDWGHWASWISKSCACSPALCNLDRCILSQITRAPSVQDESKEMKLVDRMLSSGEKPFSSLSSLSLEVGMDRRTTLPRVIELAEFITRCSKYN